MTLKRVFIYFSVSPVLLALLNFYLADLNRFTWGYDHKNEIGFAALTIAGINCLYIIFRNAHTKTHNKFWYVFASIMAIVFFSYLYLAYSFSRAGF